MLRRCFLTIVLGVALFSALSAQQASDSLTFANAPWSVKKLAKGIVLKQFHFTGDNKIFDSHQYISILEVDSKKAKGGFAFANDPGKITPTSKFAKDSGAIIAMNGTFYNMRPPYNCVCYFKKNGVEVFDNTEKMAQRDNGAVVITKKGKMYVDSARYKALGNSVAVPCVDFVMNGIRLAIEAEKAA